MDYIELSRKYKRGPQIITRKDAAAIVAETGLMPNWKCLDLGGGSGFLSLFIANLVPNGSVTCYEIRSEHADIIKQNIKISELRNVKVVNKPAEEFKGKNFDLVTIDMRGAEGVIGKAFDALREGGRIAIYSPHIEQQIACMKQLEKKFSRIKTIETSQKEWKIDTRGFSHPVPSQMVHTGYLTIAKKEVIKERPRQK
jgi:tRNA (adenine57-N1/adenine58-N1)-methyltransferase